MADGNQEGVATWSRYVWPEIPRLDQSWTFRDPRLIMGILKIEL